MTCVRPNRVLLACRASRAMCALVLALLTASCGAKSALREGPPRARPDMGTLPDMFVGPDADSGPLPDRPDLSIPEVVADCGRSPIATTPNRMLGIVATAMS